MKQHCLAPWKQPTKFGLQSCCGLFVVLAVVPVRRLQTTEVVVVVVVGGGAVIDL
jgi:hypothetical protein